MENDYSSGQEWWPQFQSIIMFSFTIYGCGACIVLMNHGQLRVDIHHCWCSTDHWNATGKGVGAERSSGSGYHVFCLVVRSESPIWQQLLKQVMKPNDAWDFQWMADDLWKTHWTSYFCSQKLLPSFPKKIMWLLFLVNGQCSLLPITHDIQYDGGAQCSLGRGSRNYI